MPVVGDDAYMLWPNAPTLEQRRWQQATVIAVHNDEYVDLQVDGSPRHDVPHRRVATAGERCWIPGPEITLEELAFVPVDVERRYRV